MIVRKFDFMFLIIFLFGITIGIQLKAGYSEQYELSFVDREIVSQINQMMKENAEISRQLKHANKKVKEFERDYLEFLNAKHRDVLDTLKSGKLTDEVTDTLTLVAKDLSGKYRS